jgi:alcohol dehydrogenase class IV
MTPFSVVAPQRILFGRGEARKAAEVAASLGRRVVLVQGRDNERTDWLRHDLAARDLGPVTLSCPREPTLEMVAQALDLARGADVIVACGGGAVIDFGKALAGLLPQPGPPLDYLEIVGTGRRFEAEPLPFVAIATTSGTGAEATKNAVIDVPLHRRKVSLRDDRMMARVAIVDPALTDGCPHGVTLASGLDALTQCIEPYLTHRANAFTDALAAAAIPRGIAALRRLMDGEEVEARDQMAWVSLAGGLCLANAGLGAVHGFAGVIGGLSGAAHGAICGTLLPHVLRANAAALAEGSESAARIARVRAWLAAAFGNADGIDALEAWSHAAGLPRLSALGVRVEDHPAIVEGAQGASSMKANPVALLPETLHDILRAAG